MGATPVLVALIVCSLDKPFVAAAFAPAPSVRTSSFCCSITESILDQRRRQKPFFLPSFLPSLVRPQRPQPNTHLFSLGLSIFSRRRSTRGGSGWALRAPRPSLPQSRGPSLQCFQHVEGYAAVLTSVKRPAHHCQHPSLPRRARKISSSAGAVQHAARLVSSSCLLLALRRPRRICSEPSRLLRPLGGREPSLRAPPASQPPSHAVPFPLHPRAVAPTG